MTDTIIAKLVLSGEPDNNLPFDVYVEGLSFYEKKKEFYI